MCPRKHLHDVVAMLKAIHAQEDKEADRQKVALVVRKLQVMKLERIVNFTKNSVEETLTYMITYGKLRTFREKAVEKGPVSGVIIGNISSISISHGRWICNVGMAWSSWCSPSQAVSRGRKFESF